VFVNFGMNDGGYKPYDGPTLQRYLSAQGALADAIKATGAREVLFTTSPVDDLVRKDDGAYNDTLSRMADALASLAAPRGLPVFAPLHPMLDVQRRAQAKDASFRLVPDGIHPNPPGHLVMTYFALRGMDVPRSVGEIAVEGGHVRATGVTAGNAAVA